MSQWGALPPERVPTLTEVVDWPETVQPSGGQTLTSPEASAPEADIASAKSGALPAAPSINEEQIAQRVLGEVQRQVDLMLEYRMREVLTPVLTRVADQIIREARAELASTLRDVVARAVAQEIARLKGR